MNANLLHQSVLKVNLVIDGTAEQVVGSNSTEGLHSPAKKGEAPINMKLTSKVKKDIL